MISNNKTWHKNQFNSIKNLIKPQLNKTIGKKTIANRF